MKHLFLFSVLAMLASGCTENSGGNETAGLKSLDPNNDAFSNVELRRSLEADFWYILGQEGAPGLPAWVGRAKEAQKVRGKENLPRVSLLLAMGCLRPLAANNPLGLANCFSYADDAVRHYGTPNSHAAYHALHAFRAMALGQKQTALEHIQLAQDRGGVEGRVVAVFAYTMFKDHALIRRALDLLEDCHGDVCNWTSSLSDYKKIIMLMVLAEVHAKLGNTEAMNDAMVRARVEARRLNWPFTHILTTLEAQIIQNGERWNANGGLIPQNAELGLIQLPMPAFNQATMCTYCHRGAELKD